MWSKIKLLFKKIKKIALYLSQILLILAFGLFLMVYNEKSNENKAKEVQSPPKLSEIFVSLEKDGNLEVYLDINNGCKYYKNFGMKYKQDAKTPDCDLKYVDEYKKKKDSKKVNLP